MLWLGKTRKREIFVKAVARGVRSNQVGAFLHDLLSLEIGAPAWWTQNDDLECTEAVAGETDQGGRWCFQVTTARIEKDRPVVAFSYAHEIAHRLLGHLEEGSYIYGEYSRREAEADAFAYAYLYVTAEKGIPGVGRISLHAITRAIRKKNEGSNGFTWDENGKLADIAQIREIWLQIRAGIKASKGKRKA